MEQEELKRKLMGLWERTTHNSKELVNTLFDYYFDIKYIEYKEQEGKIVSALCGIPYTFGFGSKRLKGMYIIYLSSEEGFKKKGVLADLLQRFNSKLESDFDFTFLVPHTELLADYFGSQGYFSSFFILEERFTPLHDFKNDYFLSLTDSDERIKELKKKLFNQIKVKEWVADYDESLQNSIISYIEEIESKGSNSLNLNHTTKDLLYLLKKDSVRNLQVFVSFDTEEKITGLFFAQKDDIKRIKLVANYVSDPCSYYVLLDFIKRQYPDYSISIVTSDTKYQIHSIIQQTYASSNPAGGDLDNTFDTIEIPLNLNRLLQPLGMVKILRFERILEYISFSRSDVDFKLHIRDYQGKNSGVKEENEISVSDIEPKGKYNDTVYTVKNGKLKTEPYSCLKDKSVLNLSVKETSELLLRKKDSSNLIMEAFGIPSLNLQIRLLPV